MDFIFDERASDSPLVETIWRTESQGGGSFTSVAESHWEIVLTTQNDKTTVTLRGPETKASLAPIPEDAEFLGITFKIGAFMPHLPTNKITDDGIHLPTGMDQSFWLDNARWELPNYENADTFVEWLIRAEILILDPVVMAVLQNRPQDLSPRSIQRHFLQAAGMSYSTLRQIERARYAVELLQQGLSPLDTTFQAGYADQPHLTRSLKRFIGQTPSQIIATEQSA